MSQSSAMYEIKIDSQYKDFADDLFRIVGIQIMANLFFYLSDPSKHEFFSSDFIRSLMFVILGITAYWLIVNKLVKFKT